MTVTIRTIRENMVVSYMTYCKFKEENKLKKYLSCIQTKRFRIALTKLRLSSHDLAMKRGRHFNVPRNERYCRNCTMQTIENHFLLVCPKFASLRRKYVTPYYCHWPSIQKCKSLLRHNSVKILNNLEKYVYYAFKNRIAFQ